MDIGTAKPPERLLRVIPHHLVDIVNPDHQFNVGEFLRRADELVKEIARRNHRPVLAGGTAYYFKTFAYGMSDAPRSLRSTRQQIERWIEQVGLEAAHGELTRLDPAYAAQISPNDHIRILRALEVFRTSGIPLWYTAIASKRLPFSLYWIVSTKARALQAY
jgi:tRNA dimethylallyltransferase